MTKTKHVCNFKIVEAVMRWHEDAIHHKPEAEAKAVKCAIGEYQEDCARCEAVDDEIFYWFQDEAELKDAMTGKHHEFIILNHEAPRAPKF